MLSSFQQISANLLSCYNILYQLKLKQSESTGLPKLFDSLKTQMEAYNNFDDF